jgi:hypothetical protein
VKKITKKKFKEATGRKPSDDDMGRVNCAAAGTIGHYQCGWCEEHDKPRLVCSCIFRTRPPVSSGIVTVNLTVAPMSNPSERPGIKRGPEGPKVVRPMTEVELELAKADMAFLIAKEKESGDWDKWKDSQRNWTGRERVAGLGPEWDGVPVQPVIDSGAIVRRSLRRRDE